MQKRLEIFTWVMLLVALPGAAGCGAEVEQPVAAKGPPEPAAPDTPSEASVSVTEASVAAPTWQTQWVSAIVAELPPPDDNSFLARAAEDRQRLDQILETDLPIERARVRTLQRRLSLRPNDADVRFELAQFYYLNDLPNLAELELLNLLDLEPEHPVAHKYLADIYLQSGTQGRAIFHARRAHHANPTDAKVLYLWGWTLRDGGDVELAREVADAGLALDPADADLLSLRALVAMDDLDDAAAEAFARRATEADPDHLRAHSLLGLALSSLGHDDEAEAELALHRRLQLLNSAKLLHVDPPLPDWERAAALAAYHMHVGNKEHAEEELARSFELEPNNPAGLTMKARLLVKAGDEAAALGVLDEALAQHPGDRRIERALANLLATAANQALRDPERAVKLATGLLDKGGAADFEVRYSLGVALAALGNEVAARMHLRAALEIEAGNLAAEAALAALEVEE